TPWCAGPACAPGTATARLHALRLAAGATPVGAPARPARGLRVLPGTLRPGGGRARGLLVRATRLGLRARRAVRAGLGGCGGAVAGRGGCWYAPRGWACGCAGRYAPCWGAAAGRCA